MTDLNRSQGNIGLQGSGSQGAGLEALQNPRWFSAGLILVGCFGAGLSGLSFREHLRSKFQQGYSSFCNLGGNFNCGEVIASKYATIFGIPTALFGVAFFLAVFFLGVLAWRRATRGIQVEALLLSCVSGCSSIVLSSISFLVLKAVCILCVGIYTVSAIFFGLSMAATLQAKRVSLGHLAQGIKSIFIFPYTVIFPDIFPDSGIAPNPARDKVGNNISLLGVMLTFSLFLWLNLVWTRAQSGALDTKHMRPSEVNSSLTAASLDAWQRGLPQIISETKGEDLAWGPENAKVTVVEFTDFECPACRAVFPQLEEAIAEFQNDIRVVFKQYPLSSRCNPNLKHEGHKHACFSAQAALCMNRLAAKAPERIVHGLFTLPGLDNDSSSEEAVQQEVLNFALSLGVSESQMLECIRSSGIASTIQRNIREGDEVRIQGTPSIFIAGREVTVRRSGQLKAVLRKAIENAQPK